MSTQTVLFDAPGPQARRRHLVLTVLAGLGLLALLWFVARELAEKDQLTAEKWNPFLTRDVWVEYLLPGIVNTLRAAAFSVVLAMAFGLVFGMGRLSHLAPVRWFCGVVVEFFRAVPVLLMMYFLFLYYALNEVFPSNLNSLAAVVSALTLYNGSVIAELVRSGVHSLPKGQGEAGLSVGLTPPQVLRSIQVPQALTAMLPALVSQLVVILKDSALGTAITYPELLDQAKNVGTAYANVIPAYFVAAAIFIALNFALSLSAGRIERRLSKRGRTTLRATGPVEGVPDQLSTAGGKDVQGVGTGAQ